MRVRIAPSILSADFACLGRYLQAAEAGGADSLHLDVMDGHFVPNLTIGPVVVESIRRATSLPLHVHLMIEEPLRYAARFAEAGADLITFHVEACVDLAGTLAEIRALGPRAGLALSPPSPVEPLGGLLEAVDFFLILAVPPGFGAQPFMPEVLPKIRRLREELERRGLATDIGVDGGINPRTAPRVVAAGANVLISGDFIFGAPEGISERIARLRDCVISAPVER